MASRVEGLERFKRKVQQRLTPKAKEISKKANRRNAQEFDGLVRRALKRGDPARGHLVDTLAMEDVGETGVQNSLGDAAHPYPMHLEGGHRNADGSHTAPQPTWNPAKVVMKKKAKARANRAASEAVKSMTTP